MVDPFDNLNVLEDIIISNNFFFVNSFFKKIVLFFRVDVDIAPYKGDTELGSMSLRRYLLFRGKASRLKLIDFLQKGCHFS